MNIKEVKSQCMCTHILQQFRGKRKAKAAKWTPAQWFSVDIHPITPSSIGLTLRSKTRNVDETEGFMNHVWWQERRGVNERWHSWWDAVFDERCIPGCRPTQTDSDYGMNINAQSALMVVDAGILAPSSDFGDRVTWKNRGMSTEVLERWHQVRQNGGDDAGD